MERLSVPFILEYLQKLHPNAHCELTHRNPYELSVAVILSAQTTDVSVNRVTPALFEAYPSPYDLAKAQRKMLRNISHPLVYIVIRQDKLLVLRKVL